MSLVRSLCAAFALALAPSLATAAASLPTAPPIEAQFDAGSLHVERYGTPATRSCCCPGSLPGRGSGTR